VTVSTRSANQPTRRVTVDKAMIVALLRATTRPAHTRKASPTSPSGQAVKGR